MITCASLSTCSPAGVDALSIGRDPLNGLIETLTLGNVSEVLDYNAHGELASQTATYAGTPLMALSYDTATRPRDALGRIATKTETFAGSTTQSDYVYDAAGRLTDVMRGTTQHEHFGYDANGNRTTRQTNGVATNVYDDQDRLTTYEGFTYTYKPNGELLTKRETATGNTWTYGYDALGNLLSVSVPNGPQITYLVDGMSRRVAKRVNSIVTKRWLYRDGLSPVAELDAAGKIVARYVYASRPNTPDFIVRYGATGTTPVTYRLLSDQLGSPRIAVEVATGAIAFRADYSSFGVQTMLAGAADWIPFGFAGGMHDP